MSFLQNQVTNFKNQYNRIVSFNKTINSKLSKSGEFSNASSYLLAALGNGSVYSAFLLYTDTLNNSLRLDSESRTLELYPRTPDPNSRALDQVPHTPETRSQSLENI